MSKDLAASIERKLLWTGRIVSAVPVLILLLSATLKIMKINGLEAGFTHLGWPMKDAGLLAFLEISCVVIYLIPRSALLGLILLTAYMGGAVATHVRVGDPCFIQILITVLLWGGLYLREPRLWRLLPLRRLVPRGK